MSKKVAVRKLTISHENTKIGKIPSFSISAIDSCPGKTTWCSKACYASKIERIYSCAKKSYENNFEIAQSSDFVPMMKAELDKLVKKDTTTFRFHVSGDFFSVRYIYDWVKLVKAYPTITFFGYTHSWSVQNLLPHIGVLRSQPNVVLFASVDQSSTTTPPKHWRVAYAGDKQLNVYPKMIDCLEQTGKIKDCATCKICFNPISTVNINFKVH
jgi:hypothetical protein